MKQFFAELFIWWHKQTLSLRIQTWLRGNYVGSDDAGNRYFEHKKNGKRWVVYNGPVEASAIPAGWHGWLHQRTDILPTDDDYQPYDWQKPHLANMSGTKNAYHPEGSLFKSGKRPKVSSDYDAFKPE